MKLNTATLTAGALALACLLNPAAVRAQVAAAAAAAPAASSAPQTGAPTFRPTRFLVQVQGSGPDVILIPGLGCSRDVWKDEAARLAPHYRLHLIQIRGFAGYPAGPNASGPLLEPIVAELAQYIEAEKLQQPAVIGHSIGGLLGLMLADKHPEDVGKLMLVDTLPFFGVLFDPKATVETVRESAAGMRQQMVEEPATNFLHDQNAVVASMVKTAPNRPKVIFWSVNSDRHTLTNAFYEDVTTDLRPDLPKIATPITLLYPYDSGKQSQKDTDKLYQQAYATAPHATLVRIDDSYHFIMLDQPEKFDAQVQKFLKS